MIYFEITQSPDHNVVTTFKYFQNQIYLGKSKGDLWIEDGDLRQSHLMLEVIEKELLIHPQKGVEFYLINGKRASVIKKLKPLDLITIGQTIIKVLGFEETPQENKKDMLNEKLNQLITINSPRISVIESLTKRMK